MEGGREGGTEGKRKRKGDEEEEEEEKRGKGGEGIIQLPDKLKY